MGEVISLLDYVRSDKSIPMNQELANRIEHWIIDNLTQSSSLNYPDKVRNFKDHVTLLIDNKKQQTTDPQELRFLETLSKYCADTSYEEFATNDSSKFIALFYITNFIDNCKVGISEDGGIQLNFLEQDLSLETNLFYQKLVQGILVDTTLIKGLISTFR